MRPERLHALCPLFDPRAEVVAEPQPRETSAGGTTAGQETLLALLERRPCTLEDLCAGLGLNPNEALKLLAPLFYQEKLYLRASEKGYFYVAGKPAAASAEAGEEEEGP
jgi:hypothetical protein